MSSVAIQDWRVSVADLSGVVKDNDLGGEVLGSAGGLVLGVGGDVSSLDVLDGDVLDVEANVVSGHGLGQRLVVHLDGLDLSGQLVRSEGDDHTCESKRIRSIMKLANSKFDALRIVLI